MATTIQFKTYTRNPDGSVSITYLENGALRGQKFASEDDISAAVAELVSGPPPDRVFLDLLAYWTARNPNRSNFALVRNKDFVEDWASPSPIKLQ